MASVNELPYGKLAAEGGEKASRSENRESETVFDFCYELFLILIISILTLLIENINIPKKLQGDIRQ